MLVFLPRWQECYLHAFQLFLASPVEIELSLLMEQVPHR